jgi:hypothetical protein
MSTTTITTNHSSIILTSSGVKTIVGKYNRRNNPELEKRRIHHCDFMGKFRNENFDPRENSLCQPQLSVWKFIDQDKNSCVIVDQIRCN